MKNFKQFLTENIDLIYDPKWFIIAWDALEQDLVVEQNGKIFPDSDEEFDPYDHAFDSEDSARDHIYEILSELEEAVENEPVIIYRGLTTDKLETRVSPQNMNWESWSVSRGVAVGLFTRQDEHSWILTGRVYYKDIDWELTVNRRVMFPEEHEIAIKNPLNVEIIQVENIGTGKLYKNITLDKERNKIILKESQSNHYDTFQQWKRNNVTLRGMKKVGEPNEVSGYLGKGLYTAPLSNRAMAKQYDDVHFVVNAIPDKPKVVNDLNQAELFIQNLVAEFCKYHNKDFDRRFFNENTTIESEVIKAGYNGLIIKGREMVHYTPPDDVKYFKTEYELKTYFLSTGYSNEKL